MEQPKAYRQSTIAAFDSCPQRAKFGMEDTRRTPSGLAARGTLLHRTWHQAVREMRATGNRTYPVDHGMSLLLENLAQLKPQVDSGEVVPISMREMRWCRVLMTKWCEYVELDPSKIIAIEKRLTAPIDLVGGGTVDITGQMDLLLMDPPDGVVVVDYKSGFRRPKTPRTGDDPVRVEEAEMEGSGLTELGWVQFLVYSYLCFKAIDWINRVVFREVTVLRQEERQGRMTAFQMERLTDPLRAQVTMLHTAVQEGPESKRWVATAGQHCALCPKPWDCSIMQESGLDLYTEAGRKRAAEKWIVAGEQRKEVEDFLKGAGDAYGPIAVRGGKIVGWDMEKKRWGLHDSYDPPPSHWDEELEQIGREVGLIQE